MRLFTALVLAGLTAWSDAVFLLKKELPSVLRAPIQRRGNLLEPHIRDRIRRDTSTLSLNIENEQTLYYANVSIGTPPQALSLHLDTGSSDLWVNTPSSHLCRHGNCQAAGTYIANRSSTYHYLNGLFNVTYVDGSGAQGDYATDNLLIDSLTIDDFQFGIGYQSTTPQGILGVGYPQNEVLLGHYGEKPYPNLPAALKNDGVIAAMAFSLWLNDLESASGNILFGGVDTMKFEGSLHTLPIIPYEGVYAEYVIALTGLGQNGETGSVIDNAAIPVILDAGSSLTYLPNDIVNSIYKAFNAKEDPSTGSAIVDCSIQNQNGTIDFTFSNDNTATISVGLSEMILLGGYNGNQPFCIFGIGPSGDTNPVLGDTFLRSAYVVYDLTSNEISLGQTRFNVTSDENIMQIESTSSGGVPSATLVPHPVTSVQNIQSNGARVGSGGATIESEGAVAQITPPPGILYGAAVAVGWGAVLAI